MKPFLRTRVYDGPVRAVVLDWAGTAVDHGCPGPAAVFVRAFALHGVEVSVAEAREPMGSEKREHVRRMLGMDGVADRWRAAHGHVPGEAAVDAVYRDVEPLMLQTIAAHAAPVPGLGEFVDMVRGRGMGLGSCTGYTGPMMEVLVPEAARRGYSPDVVVHASEVPAGRPYPWMCYLNAMRLGVHPMESMVKIGDTVADMHEGRNAGMWTVGVVRTGNGVGLSEVDAARMPPDQLAARMAVATARLREAGAHYVVDSIADCFSVIEAIEARLARGEAPYPT
ncbi:phosphonoacetaldehyde hydrolase [Nitratidesulfovibrio liaohensis]|uniref:Phosphonoacetaldehyde hydrolase n=1 Tax=Nitratidesulfovibrio liaohensis TaxID=2604158 RepID=A0ABY9R2U7_9BACT|nr:phosphonoacetaldehyde hydrolase [Nitratidesulfovibrio liaohensis]WMW66086.1 phosphonoacetaldehyde hydrolase [Nitratidesulfovibrio liaohensis]